MGIARRKAGAVVRCPTCAGQVVVPDPGLAGAAPPGEEPGLFERPDFDAAFPHVPGRGAAPAPVTRPPAGRVDVEPFALPDQRPPQRGVFLSSGKVVLLIALVFLLLGLAFLAGLLVGRSQARPALAATGHTLSSSLPHS